MTILFVSHYSGFYGAAKSMVALIADLRKRYDVTPIVLLPNEGQLCTELEKLHIKYYVSHYYWWVNYNHGLFQFLLNKRKQLLNLCKVKSIIKAIRCEEIDLVYSNSVTVDIGFFMAKKMGLPHIWQFRESLYQFNLSLPLSLSLSLLNNPVNKKYILISDYMMNYYSHLLPNDRMIRIYNGIALPATKRTANTAANNIFNLCMTGVISKQKNQMDAVEAVNILHCKGVNNIRLYIVGTSQCDYLNIVEDAVARYGLEKYVILIGHQDDVHSLLDLMNIGLMCSENEAFGRSTVEYMVHRMPVIVSKSGANTELICEGVNGFSYELHNAQVLADIIETLISNPEKMDSMGEAAVKWASDYFSLHSNTDLIYGQIKEVLS